MDTIIFENAFLPVYIGTESITAHRAHSEIAHYHDSVELIVITRGKVVCRTDGAEFELHSGDVCFINRRHIHSLRPIEGSDCTHKVLIVGTGMIASNAQIYDKYVRPMLEDPKFSHIRFTGRESPSAEIAALVGEMEKLQKHRESGYELEMVSATMRLWRQLYLAYTAAPSNRQADNNAALQQRMAEFIYNNFSEQITLDDIAAAGSVSRSQCTKLFNRYTELSPIAFLNDHRLEVSLELLRRTSKSVAEIARCCGFSDQSYFSRMFQRRYGLTPLAYRKSGIMPASEGRYED